MKLAYGILLAVAGAGMLNLGFHIQHDATHGAELSLRHPLRGALRLVTDRDWLIGYASGWIGWGLYLAALWLAPLSVVQSVAAGGLGLLALLAHRFGAPLVQRERWGAGLAVAGLVLLFISLSAAGVSTHHPHRTEALSVLITGTAIGLVAGLVGLQRRVGGWVLALAAGLFYAMGDVAAKAALDGHVVLFLPFVLACTAVGFVCQQLSFPRGPVMATAGLTNLVNNTVPIVAGVILFHEGLPHGPAGAARVAGFLAVVVGAVLLARRPATESEGAEGSEPCPDVLAQNEATST